MKKSITLLATMLIAVSIAIPAHAEFAMPDAAQIAAAAADASLIAAMLEGASPQQAAVVLRSVVLNILSQDLPDAAIRGQVAAAIRVALNAMLPEVRAAFAEALGTEAGATLAISREPSVLSALQAELASAGAAAGLNLGDLFSQAYLDVMDAGGTASSNVLTPREEVGRAPLPIPPPTPATPTPPRRPPVARPYRGQTI